jgi:hypothetical protein
VSQNVVSVVSLVAKLECNKLNGTIKICSLYHHYKREHVVKLLFVTTVKSGLNMLALNGILLQL